MYFGPNNGRLSEIAIDDDDLPNPWLAHIAMCACHGCYGGRCVRCVRSSAIAKSLANSPTSRALTHRVHELISVCPVGNGNTAVIYYLMCCISRTLKRWATQERGNQQTGTRTELNDFYCTAAESLEPGVCPPMVVSLLDLVPACAQLCDPSHERSFVTLAPHLVGIHLANEYVTP
jgi:hypothetical protein